MKLKVIIMTCMSVAAGWVDKLLFTVARVARAQDIGEQFRILTLEGAALTQTGGAPGDKIQVRAAALALRTYTPIGWDKAQGRVQLFTFLHGDGPGARWARTAQSGDDCSFFGPRRSVALADLSGPIVLFGDETSFGVGAALARLRPDASRLVFEVGSRAALDALDAFELTARTVEQKPEGSHLRKASDYLLEGGTDPTVVLTGRGSSIRTVREHLREAGLNKERIKAKAYWMEGKKGMD